MEKSYPGCPLCWSNVNPANFPVSAFPTLALLTLTNSSPLTVDTAEVTILSGWLP